MSNINKLAQAIISDIRLKHGSDDFYAPIIRWDEFKVITGALEAADKRIAELEAREVVLPQRHSMLHRDNFDEPYHTEFVYKQHQVLKVLHDAGISIKGE